VGTEDTVQQPIPTPSPARTFFRGVLLALGCYALGMGLAAFVQVSDLDVSLSKDSLLTAEGVVGLAGVVVLPLSAVLLRRRALAAGLLVGALLGCAVVAYWVLVNALRGAIRG
jgi:hypothetical protein